jgi:hypothetical protein
MDKIEKKNQLEKEKKSSQTIELAYQIAVRIISLG